MLENKLGLTSFADLAREEERISKKKVVELFEKGIEINHILKEALTDEINSSEVYMRGIDHSYCYEGYATFRTEEL